MNAMKLLCCLAIACVTCALAQETLKQDTLQKESQDPNQEPEYWSELHARGMSSLEVKVLEIRRPQPDVVQVDRIVEDRDRGASPDRRKILAAEFRTAHPSDIDDPKRVFLRLAKLRKHRSEMPNHRWLRDLGGVLIMKGAGDTTKQRTLLVGVQVPDGCALRELGAVPLVEQCVSAFFVECDSVFGNRVPQEAMYDADDCC